MRLRSPFDMHQPAMRTEYRPWQTRMQKLYRHTVPVRNSTCYHHTVTVAAHVWLGSNSTLRYECDETFSDVKKTFIRTSIVRNFISRGVKMRISAREACVKPHLRTRSDIKVHFSALRYKENSSAPMNS